MCTKGKNVSKWNVAQERRKIKINDEKGCDVHKRTKYLNYMQQGRSLLGLIGCPR